MIVPGQEPQPSEDQYQAPEQQVQSPEMSQQPAPSQSQPPAQQTPQQPATVEQRAVDFMRTADPEVARYIASAYAGIGLENAVQQGRVIPKDKIPREEPKPPPTQDFGPPAEFAKQIRRLAKEAYESGDPTELYWQLFSGALGQANSQAEEKMKQLLQEELGPLRDQQAWSDFNRLEKEFYGGKEDLDDELRTDLSTLMRREDGASAPEIYALMQKYANKKEERSRQVAAAQAAQRSEAITTGFMETPQRGGFTSPAGHQTEDLRKQILDAYKSGDEALARRLGRRWQGEG